jgi:hypothetical protein
MAPRYQVPDARGVQADDPPRWAKVEPAEQDLVKHAARNRPATPLINQRS